MKMKNSVTATAVLLVILGLMSRQSHAQNPVIESLSLNGELVCTGLKPGSTATVEWAPTVDGPWTNSWAGLDAVVVDADGTIRVKVPMFYRVRAEAEAPGPAGMVWIPPGTFTMGSPSNEPGRGPEEGPQTVVTLTRGFWMGKYELTQREYLALMRYNPSFFSDLDRPVDNVSWYEAEAYCNLLTARELAAGRLPAGYEYRLPTEAQWEYACRAGAATRFSFGDALECDDCCGVCSTANQYMWWCGNSAEHSHRVGHKLSNSWGLYDMHANLEEWCADWWVGSLSGGSVTDPGGPASGAVRVLRGGSFRHFLLSCRSAWRAGYRCDGRDSHIGFRVALVAVP